ncbi:unannotated protein [freshwater metagenome]|uniref:histidine kinase n=1 Tax=freshwater metagenome TaxID=449393 RepID=A0A6J7EKD7_9ZZZZ
MPDNLENRPVTAADLESTKRLLNAVTTVAGLLHSNVGPTELFEPLLADLLALSGSEYGYIAEVLYDVAGDPYLQTRAITDITWDDSTRRLFDEHVVHGEGLQFRNLDSLFGWGLREGGRVVVANDVATDARCVGRPAGHPALTSFLGIPIMAGKELVGQIGVANRSAGYDDDILAYLEPFVVAVGNLISGHRAHRTRQLAELTLRERTSEMNAFLANLQIGTLFVDDDMRILFANQTFCRMFGYKMPPEELAGLPTSMIRAQAERAVSDGEAFGRSIATNYKDNLERVGELIRMADGRLLGRDYATVRLMGGRKAHLWAYSDLTQRAQHDEDGRLTLQHERELRAATEEQNQRLSDIDEMRAHFMATVSHELRTPLTAIAGFAELLLDDQPSSPQQQREFVEIISRNSQRMLEMVESLLLMARLEGGGLGIEIRPTPLAGLVREVMATFAPEAAKKHVELLVSLSDSLAPAMIDPGRMDEVMRNLISNAVKFTPEGGWVSVTTRRWGDCWEIEVADNGIGVPAADIDRLFDRFYRGSNIRPGQHPGSGLGLAIARSIVELHGGSISATSGTLGAVFTVRLSDQSQAAGSADSSTGIGDR